MMTIHNGVYIEEEDQSISKWVMQSGELGDSRFSWMNQWIKPGSIAIDIGASIGDSTRFISKTAKTVIALEPNPLLYRCLVSNCPTSICLPVGAGCATQLAYLVVEDGKMDNGYITLDSQGKSGVAIVTVPIDALNIDPDFIKIDCEGSELDVILGAMDTISRCRPEIVCELCDHHLNRRHHGDSKHTVITKMESIGYKSLQLTESDYLFSI